MPHRTTPPVPGRRYTYQDVARRLAEAFPDHRPVPQAASLRAAVGSRSPTDMAAGLPPRLNPGERTALFDAEAVDRWIREHHPWLNRCAALDQVTERWAAGDRRAALRAGREAGLSWEDLAVARSRVPGEPRVSREAMRRLGQRLLEPRAAGGGQWLNTTIVAIPPRLMATP